VSVSCGGFVVFQHLSQLATARPMENLAFSESVKPRFITVSF
jgi:hypothetical protein